MYYKKETIWIEQLTRYAKLYVGLPDNYEETDRLYPVLYMHDGHNVFDQKDSYAGKTWEILKAYQNHPDLKDVIVVALECAHGIERLNEYGPFPFTFEGFEFSETPGGKADLYLDYLVTDLKPMIDKTYRTLTDKKNTAMMGSSMGGVVSLYAAIKYPNVFGRIAAVSSAFYVSLEPILKLIKITNFNHLDIMYMDTGTEEVGGGNKKDYIVSNDQVYDMLKSKIDANKLVYKKIKGGKHSEEDWAKRLPDILKIIL